MDHTAPAHSSASLTAALDRVDAALAEPDRAWLDRLASLGVWGAWLRWILQLLAFEFALAGGEPGQLPGAAAQAAAPRQLSARTLDRQIDRLIEAAARVWNMDGQTSDRPCRPRWRRLLQLVLRWLGYLHCRFRPDRVRVCRFRSAPVLALCQQACRHDTGSRNQPHRGSTLLDAPGRAMACGARHASATGPGGMR